MDLIFFKGDRFPATLSFTHDAVLNSHGLKLQYKDLTALHLFHTPHHMIFNNNALSVWNIFGRYQCQNTPWPYGIWLMFITGQQTTG